MSPTELLKDAEADLASLAGLPGEIRAKVKAGIAELTRIRDAVETTIATLTGGAQATLTSLQSLATQDAATAATDPADPVAVEPAAPPAAPGSVGP